MEPFRHLPFALAPDARFTWLEDASHFAHVDAPERFLDAVMPCLEELPIRVRA
jgi:pimeloyl-ACP methyl ester carboxylesterase